MAVAGRPGSTAPTVRLRAVVRALRAQLGDFALRNLINAGAVAGAGVLFAAGGPRERGTAGSGWLEAVGVLLAVASLVAIIARRRRLFRHPGRAGLLGYFVSVRAVLFFALGAGYVLQRPDERGWIWAAVSLAVLLVLSEPLVKGLLDTTKQVVTQLPGVQPVPKPPFGPGWVAMATVVEMVLGALLAALSAPPWIFLVVVVLSVPVLALLVRYAVLANVLSKRAEVQIPQALRRLKPAFVVYYATVSGARYQLGMWLPYLERLQQPFFVITRSPETVPVIAELTKAPIIVAKQDNVSGSLDAMVVPSLEAAFYVQGSPANQTMQRYRQLTHVWLNHGDSDKQANFHPRHATYDKLFVSGQQGVERYAKHGIEVPPDRFVIVGRPQIETIESRTEPLPAGAPRTVLYAPTWKGGRPSTNYSSLPLGLDIIRALIERGATVIFRPHPVSYEDRADARRIRSIHQLLEADRVASAQSGGPERRHVWGAKAEKEWDVPACFNASDALVTDVSSIASDYLASGKPFAMVAMLSGGAAFANEFPMAKVAYVIEKDLSTLPVVLSHLLGEDPLLADRLAYRSFCLGPSVGPGAAEPFLRIAGEIVAGRS